MNEQKELFPPNAAGSCTDQVVQGVKGAGILAGAAGRLLHKPG